MVAKLLLFTIFSMFIASSNSLVTSSIVKVIRKLDSLPSRYTYQLAAFRSNQGPPKQPKNFGKDFYIEPRTEKLKLELANPHPNDAFISFNEGAHTYTYNKKPLTTSVTQLVGSYFSEFNAEEAVTKMMNGKRWPREEYMKEDGVTPLTKEEIIKKWDSQGEYARNCGTWMHYNIELYLNDLVRQSIIFTYTR